MAAAKGTRPPNAGKGRKAGVPNKVTKDLKDMILGALHRAGGEDYLLQRAQDENPTPFLALVGKCLPKDLQVTATVTLTDLLREVEARRAKRGT
jgi:hypothetical protein